MTFDLLDAASILRRTPGVLRHMLHGLSEGWTHSNEGADTWSPYDIVGHLIHGEETDWMPRLRIILEQGEARPFTPFDRFAQFQRSRGKSLADLLDRFEQLRGDNISALETLDLTPEQLELRGTHPDLGRVTAGQLLATWVVHDLGHIAQTARVLAHQYVGEVGPWQAYLPILTPRG